jgi:1,4-dihydroxy-2-naphthoate octaprenyltransferase
MVAGRRGRRKSNGIVLAIVLISISAGLIFYGVMGVNWTIIPSLICIAVGIAYTGLSFRLQGNEPLEYYFGPKQSSYLLGWGLILTFIGVLILGVFVIGGLNIVILIAILLLVLGIISLISFGRAKER